MESNLYHWLLIAAFIRVVIWAFGHKRKTRIADDAKISFGGISAENPEPSCCMANQARQFV